MEQTQNRAWAQLNEESFKKIQDLEAILANNRETVLALEESIRVHSEGLNLLNTPGVERVRDQFGNIIEAQSKAKDNLLSYNANATDFINKLRSTDDQETIALVEAFLKIVSFK